MNAMSGMNGTLKRSCLCPSWLWRWLENGRRCGKGRLRERHHPCLGLRRWHRVRWLMRRMSVHLLRLHRELRSNRLWMNRLRVMRDLG